MLMSKKLHCSLKINWSGSFEGTTLESIRPSRSHTGYLIVSVRFTRDGNVYSTRTIFVTFIIIVFVF